MNQETKVEIPAGALSELDTLKNRAKMMGLKFHPSIGLKSLKQRIDEKLSSVPDNPDNVASQTEVATGDAEDKKKRSWLTHDEYMAETRKRTRITLNRLVRCRITCLNPNKTEWEGEIFSVGSAKVGTFKKFVPFNTDDGFHVPLIIYQAIVAREYTSFYNVKGPRGNTIRKGKLVKEYNVEVMAPLTPEELQELKQRQIASNAID